MNKLGLNLGLSRFAVCIKGDYFPYPPSTPDSSLINSIIDWFNILTDSSDTIYDGINPSILDIETYIDTLNGEII